MERTGSGDTVREKRGRDDRILPQTRWLAALIIPFLVVAFGILYLLPDHTQELFAWTIRPRMTPMMLGAAYIAGTYFFVCAATFARWHWVKVGFLPVTVFATFMGIATLLHWNSFNHSHISFFAWLSCTSPPHSSFWAPGFATSTPILAHPMTMTSSCHDLYASSLVALA